MRRASFKANDEMVRGYRDGLEADSPEPGPNQTHSYRHGFANGRDDLRRKPRATWDELIEMADEAMRKDAEIYP